MTYNGSRHKPEVQLKFLYLRHPFDFRCQILKFSRSSIVTCEPPPKYSVSFSFSFFHHNVACSLLSPPNPGIRYYQHILYLHCGGVNTIRYSGHASMICYRLYLHNYRPSIAWSVLPYNADDASDRFG